MRRPKAKSQLDHADTRLRERYGLRLTQYLKDQLVTSIRNGSAKFVVRQSNRITVFDVLCKVRREEVVDERLSKPGNVEVRVVYDKSRGTIVTALPRDVSVMNMNFNQNFLEAV